MVLLKKFHKWVSVVVGIQFLIWLISGLSLNIMDHTKAAGHTYKKHHHASMEWQNLTLIDPKIVLAQQAPSTSLKLISLNARPYYLLNHERGLYAYLANTHSLVDAVHAGLVTLDQAMAQSLAQEVYSGPGGIQSATRMTPPLAEFPKQKNAVWRVNFADDVQTSVYIEADTGRVVGHSDKHKRLADFFLMLHFMDYANEGSFNNIQVIVFAFLALFLSVTGLIWTIDLGLRGQYKITLFGRRKTSK